MSKRKGTDSFSVTAGDAVATARTSNYTTRGPVVIVDDAYTQWKKAEPSDMSSPEWDAWMDRWPG